MDALMMAIFGSLLIGSVAIGLVIYKTDISAQSFRTKMGRNLFVILFVVILVSQLPSTSGIYTMVGVVIGAVGAAGIFSVPVDRLLARASSSQ
jgi:hypothetical protein